MTSYASVDELKKRLAIVDSASDDVLTEIIARASRAIDGLTGSFFYPSLRVITLKIEDEKTIFTPWPFFALVSLEVSVDGDNFTTRALNSFYFVPEYPPFRALRARYELFPRGGFARVNAQFGYASVPDAIKEATLLLAARLFKRPETALGVAGTNAFGVVRLPEAADPDIVALIAPFRVFDAF